MKRKVLKKFLFTSIMAFSISFAAVACTGNGKKEQAEASQQHDDLALYITAMEQAVEKNSDLSIKFPFKTDDYVVADLGDGNIDIRTDKASINGEDVRVRLAFTVDKESQAFTYHFLEIGSDVLLDDNTLD